MNQVETNIKNLFKNATTNNFWKSPDDVSIILGVPKQLIIDLVIDSSEFVTTPTNSTSITKFTTRRNFNKFQSIGSKFLGALKNRAL